MTRLRRSIPPVVGPIAARTLLHAAVCHRAENVVARAEEALVSRYRGYHARLTRSGTAALESAIREAHRRAGQPGLAPVALPAWCCPDVASAAIGAGQPITLYDLDPRSLAPDFGSVERALREGARTLVIVHFFGRLTDPTPWLALAQDYGATVIEDAAQSAGALREGHLMNMTAPLGVVSFGRGKGRHAGGGGALLSDAPFSEPPPEVGSGVLELSVVLRAIAVAMLAHPWLFGLARAMPIGLGETHFVPPSSDHRISRVVAALVPPALAREQQDANRRWLHASEWRKHLADRQHVLLTDDGVGERHGALRFPILSEPTRMAGLSHLGVFRGYPARLDQYPEIHPHLIRIADHLPGATELAEQLHTLPNHDYVRAIDRAQILEAIRA